MAWLAASDPAELFHFHALGHLESDACRFEGLKPKNVWSLQQSETPIAPPDAPQGSEVLHFELTFQVLREEQLDELARSQASGLTPEQFDKQYASVVMSCE